MLKTQTSTETLTEASIYGMSDFVAIGKPQKVNAPKLLIFI